MRNILFILLCCIPTIFTSANDGVFYAQGNQLIPANETDISVQKEVLTLNRVGDQIKVTVYYEFNNPADEKNVLVGFEAQGGGDDDPSRTFPEHPCINNFKVVLNGAPVDYEIAHTDHSDYIYYFNVKFRPGLNIIQHTYDFEISYTVEDEFYFPYILTAANRWANHQIDDFTLNIDMGDYTSFHLFPTFFKNGDEWSIQGIGKYTTDTVWGYTDGKETPVFHIQHGNIKYKKTNFHPDGELMIRQRRCDWYSEWFWDHSVSLQGITDSFKSQYIPIRVPMYDVVYDDEEEMTLFYKSVSPEQRRILKNMPFAYKGYIFKDKTLQDYFESTNWYIPNPDYKSDMGTLDEKEREWVEFWK